MKIGLLVLAALLISTHAKAVDCNTDCNQECCSVVQITPWDRNTICEPTCKMTCEASKAICQGSLQQGNGMTADRDFICMNDNFFNNADHYHTVITLAHEMVHVRQYRRLGTD